MRKTYLLWFACLAFLMGCRNEDFTTQYVNSKREEEFFRQAIEKTSRFKNGSSIVAALKKQNERSHFVSKLKDQSGLPIWDKVITIRKPTTLNKGEDGSGDNDFEKLVIPLTENEKGLSSVLYVTKYPDGSYTFNNIDNADLKQMIFNTQIDKAYREQLLSSFIVIDDLSFSSDATYWNIPDDIFTFIPQSDTYPQRRFQIKMDNPETGGGTNNLMDSEVICYTITIECGGCTGGVKDKEVCFAVFYGSTGTYDGGSTGTGGAGTGTGDGGNTNGGGGDGMPGGDPGNGNPGNPGNNGGSDSNGCGGENHTFYKIVPGCDDDGGGNGHLDSPCEKIAAKFADTRFSEKYNELNKPENFNLDREKAYIMRYPPVGTNIPPAYFQVDMPPCATGNEDAVMPSNNAGLAGLMHTHTNSTCNGSYPIKAPSPVDIKYLLNTLLSQANQYTGSYSNAYSITVTSGGSYMLMYTGTTYPGSLDYDTVTKLKEDYKKEYQKLYDKKDNDVTQADIEKVFTKFMKEKINKPGLEVYRITPSSAVKIEYDTASPNSVKQTPCP